MTAEDLAALYRLGFPEGRPWSAKEIASLLADPKVALLSHPQGFALTRSVADESELLTLVVHPDHRRQRIADGLLARWLHTAQATHAFLEVAADNHAAQALYRKHGFAKAGRRKAYYRRATGPAVDAVLMTAALPGHQAPESPGKPSKTG